MGDDSTTNKPLTLESAIAERDEIIKQLNEVVPKLQIRLSYLHGWIDSQSANTGNSTSPSDPANGASSSKASDKQNHKTTIKT